MAQLSTEQILLLNNLMYIGNKRLNNFEGETVGDWLGTFTNDDITALVNSDKLKMTSFEEWSNIINAAKNDYDVSNMTIAASHFDNAEGGGNGFSAIFLNKDSGEAVVAFEGTAGGEWKDNFAGGAAGTGAADNVSTKQQVNALDWYKEAYNEYGLDGYSVTVTGHSKGGNKSKYIAIMDDSVDRCVSFDGQGFSDEFIDAYSDRISYRQDIIQNHNVDHDYVNILLNDVGETTYYKGYDKGSFLENHCPNTFFKFESDGSYSMNVAPNGQAPELKQVDEFFNSYLRTLSDTDKYMTMKMLGTIAEGTMKSGKKMSTDEIVNLLLGSEYRIETAKLLAYLMRYEQENSGFKNALEKLMGDLGVEGASGIMTTVDAIIGIIGDGSGFLGFTLDQILVSKWCLEKIQGLLKALGIKLSLEELENYIRLVKYVNEELPSIKIKKNSGKDKKVKSKPNPNATTGSGRAEFWLNIDKMIEAVTNLENASKKMSNIENQLDNLQASLEPEITKLLGARIKSIEKRLNSTKDSGNRLSSALSEIVMTYDRTEKEIIDNVKIMII